MRRMITNKQIEVIENLQKIPMSYGSFQEDESEFKIPVNFFGHVTIPEGASAAIIQFVRAEPVSLTSAAAAALNYSKGVNFITLEPDLLGCNRDTLESTQFVIMDNYFQTVKMKLKFSYDDEMWAVDGGEWVDLEEGDVIVFTAQNGLWVTYEA